ELLYTDIKYILGHNPLFPAYSPESIEQIEAEAWGGAVRIPAGIYEIGFEGSGFCFDNELCRHQVYLEEAEISRSLVTNGEYLAFMQDGGYEDFRHWHAEGWEWVKSSGAKSPLYWYLVDGQWQHYTLHGLQPIDLNMAVCHIN